MVVPRFLGYSVYWALPRLHLDPTRVTHLALVGGSPSEDFLRTQGLEHETCLSGTKSLATWTNPRWCQLLFSGSGYCHVVGDFLEPWVRLLRLVYAENRRWSTWTGCISRPLNY